MSETGHMNFFKVNDCGLYKQGSKKNFGCKLEETFDLIGTWIAKRNFDNTSPWDEGSRADKGKPNCYCRDFYKDDSTKDFLVVLWKSDVGDMSKLLGV